MLERDSAWGRFVDSILGKIEDDRVARFWSLNFVDAFHPMIVPIVQPKLSSSLERPNTTFLCLAGNRDEGQELWCVHVYKFYQLFLLY